MNNDLINLTDSELSRLNLHEETQNTLLSFLNVYVEQLTEDEPMLIAVRDEIFARLTDEERRISDTLLFNILKLLTESKTAKAVALLNVIKENQKVTIENTINNPSPQHGHTYDLSNEEVSDAKEAVRLFNELNNIIKNEKSEEELEKDK